MRIDNHTHVGFDPLFYYQGWSPYALPLSHLILESENTGIDILITFPFVSYTALDLEALKQKKIELPAASGSVPYAFENWRLCEELRTSPPEWREKVWPFIITDPARKPQEQVAEWGKLPKDYRFRGIKIQGTIIQSKILSLLDVGSCILDYAEEHNLPLLIHSSIRKEDEWSQCADIIRVAEARPGVRFVLAHSCRFHLPSLQRVAELDNAWFDISAFVIHCQCAAQNHPAVAVPEERFQTDYTSPETVLRDLAEAYPNKLIWGTDSPFHSIQYEHVRMTSSYRREVACLDALPKDVQERVSYKNTMAWLGTEGQRRG